MSEDLAQADTDLDGDRPAQSGIYEIGDGGSHYDLDHGITLICDSHRHLIRRWTVRFGDRKRKRTRMPCPECGRLVTVYLRQVAQ